MTDVTPSLQTCEASLSSLEDSAAPNISLTSWWLFALGYNLNAFEIEKYPLMVIFFMQSWIPDELNCTESHSWRPVLSTESCHGDQISCIVGVIVKIPTSALRNLFLGQKSDPGGLYRTSCEGQVRLAQTYGEQKSSFLSTCQPSRAFCVWH